MSAWSVPSFKLLDGTSIPRLGWGCGTGRAQQAALECGLQALAAGIRHIDTAQVYMTERETGQVISQSSIQRGEVYVTTKISSLQTMDGEEPVPLNQVRSSVEGSIDKLGFIPNLFLIHGPSVAPSGQLKEMWMILEDLKIEGKLRTIGVSNFRPQDLEEILEDARFKPVVNQIEYHPYTLAHLEPLLALQGKHGIVTEAYGALTPILRHPTGGPLKPVLDRIAARLSHKFNGKTIDAITVLLLWTRAQGVVAVTASGNADHIECLGEISTLPNVLEQREIDEITKVGKTVHFRFYRDEMEQDYPLPDLPDGT